MITHGELNFRRERPRDFGVTAGSISRHELVITSSRASSRVRSHTLWGRALTHTGAAPSSSRSPARTPTPRPPAMVPAPKGTFPAQKGGQKGWLLKAGINPRRRAHKTRALTTELHQTIQIEFFAKKSPRPREAPFKSMPPLAARDPVHGATRAAAWRGTPVEYVPGARRSASSAGKAQCWPLCKGGAGENVYAPHRLPSRPPRSESHLARPPPPIQWGGAFSPPPHRPCVASQGGQRGGFGGPRVRPGHAVKIPTLPPRHW